MADKQASQEQLSTGEILRRRQKSKNIALGLAVGGLCLLFYVISIVRMGGAG